MCEKTRCTGYFERNNEQGPQQGIFLHQVSGHFTQGIRQNNENSIQAPEAPGELKIGKTDSDQYKKYVLKVNNVLEKDLECSSPSMAAALIAGGSKMMKSFMEGK
jgi:hypothetical protein